MTTDGPYDSDAPDDGWPFSDGPTGDGQGGPPLEPAANPRARMLLVAAGLLAVVGLTATAVALTGDDGGGPQERLAASSTPTPSEEPTPLPTGTPSPTATPTPTPTPSATPTPSPTATPTPSATAPPVTTRTPSATPSPTTVPTASPSATPSATPVPRTAELIVVNRSSEAARLTVNADDTTVPAGTSRTVTVVVRGDDNDVVFLGSAVNDCGTEETGGFGLVAGRTYAVEIVDSDPPTCLVDGATTPVTSPVFADAPPWVPIA